MSAPENVSRAAALVDATWDWLSRRPVLSLLKGRTPERLPDLSEGEASRTAARARDTLAAIRALDLEALPHDLALSLRVVRFQMELDAQAHSRYHLAQTYGLFPAIFPISPYGAGLVFDSVGRIFEKFRFAQTSDQERYLALVEDYGILIDQMRAKLIEQARVGIRIPKVALPGVRTFVARQIAVVSDVVPVRQRLNGKRGESGRFADVVLSQVESRLIPAIRKLLEVIDADYCRSAPEGVGIGQFEQGPAIYESLVAEHASARISSEAVHRAGKERLEEVEVEMKEIREDLGYTDRDSFHRYLRCDSQWASRDEVAVRDRFASALERMEARIDELFRFRPKAPYSFRRISAELERNFTAGYYQPPGDGNPEGVYYYNVSNLIEGTLATLSSLVYHELIPGHHFHIAIQRESVHLHPLRKTLLFNTFNEGWAEYAAALAGEVGMYPTPTERYGRLLKEAYYCCRLVVDPGLNVLGWTLEQARMYLGAHTMLSESEIESEILRYSTDIPAQCLAYKLGEMKIREVRECARQAMGGRFDLREFHDVVLSTGGLPLEVLEWHVNSWLKSDPVRGPGLTKV
jgi:uncharacterized protein (DUF885 family)